MDRILVIVTCWNRPRLLRKTLDSLFLRFPSETCDIVAIDNGSELETRQILKAETRLAGSHFHIKNKGINVAIESALERFLRSEHEWVMTSDADMEYRRPPSTAVEFMKRFAEVGAVSFQHSPEHPAQGAAEWNGELWPLKSTERGCALLTSVKNLQRVRPLPVHNLIDFDWWLCRNSPQSLQAAHQSIAVYVGGACHLGWRKGDSTWQRWEIAEYPEFRK